MADQGLLFNPISLALRSRLAAAAPQDQPIVRLNLAVSLLRTGDTRARGSSSRRCSCRRARGISLGTQQYLLGLVHESEGDAASAQRSFQAAAASGGLLTEDGPAIATLARRKLSGTPRGSSEP